MYFVSLHYSSSINYKHWGRSVQTWHILYISDVFVVVVFFIYIRHILRRPGFVKIKVLVS